MSGSFDLVNDRLVLVVGGGGYIGSPVINHLLAIGYKVRMLDPFIYSTQSATSGLLLNDRYTMLKGDMCNAADRARALEGVTDVVMLAGLVGDPVTKTYPAESELINDIGMVSFIKDLESRKLKRTVFISTCSNYGLMPEGVLADEKSPLSPLSLYAKAKVKMEGEVLSRPSINPVVLRFATAFGAAPRMRFDLTVNEFTREMYAGNVLEVFDAHTWRPYCHVKDFARLIGMVLVADDDKVLGQMFNAGGEINNHTKKSIVDIILSRIPDAQVVYREKGSDPRNYRVNFDKVRSVLGFTPTMTVENGVDEIISLLSTGFWSDFQSQHPFYGNYVVKYEPAH